MQYTSKFSGEEIDLILDNVAGKQDAIPDLETIRSNAKNASDTIARMVESGYLFAGIATIGTNPGIPDTKVFYIANGKGTYEKFGGLEVTEDEMVVLYWDSAWHKVATGISSQAKLSELENEVDDLNTLAGVTSNIIENPTWEEYGVNRITGELTAPNHKHCEINLNAGDILILTKCYCYASVSMFAKRIGEKYVNIQQGADGFSDYKYIADEDGIYCISCGSTTLDLITIKKIDSESFEKVYTKIQGMGLSLSEDIVKNTDLIKKNKDDIVLLDAEINGSFEDKSAELSWEAGGITIIGELYGTVFYHANIQLNKGHKIYYKTYINSENFVPFSKVNNNNPQFYDIINPEQGVPVEQNYICEEDGIYVITTTHETINAVVVKVSINGLSDDVNSLKSELTPFELLPSINDNPLAKISVEGTLTGLFRTWGFIGDSLASGEIWGWNKNTYILEVSKVGKRVNANGDIEDAVGWAISKPIRNIDYKPVFNVKFASSLSSGIAVLSTTNIGETSYTPVMLSDGRSNYTTPDNNNLNAAYVVVSYKTSDVPNVQCISTYVNDNYDISWGQYMCRMLGASGYNFSQGGQTTKGWMLDSLSDKNRSHQGFITSEQKQAYIIALGVNDTLQAGNVETDIKQNLEENADTFAGWYGRIIQTINSRFDDSTIFVVTIPEKETKYVGYNKVIRDIANRFVNVYLIDLERYNTKSSWFGNSFQVNGIHLNSQGYLYTAYEFITYIDWIIRNNMITFRNACFAGTGASGNKPSFD